MENKKRWNDLKTAVLFAVSFVLFAAVNFILQQHTIPGLWKAAAVVTYLFLVFRLIKMDQLIKFAGYCMLMLGVNYVWKDGDIHVFWKVAATIVVLLQFGSLDEREKTGPHNLA